jgi:hypothetical protein
METLTQIKQLLKNNNRLGTNPESLLSKLSHHIITLENHDLPTHKKITNENELKQYQEQINIIKHGMEELQLGGACMHGADKGPHCYKCDGKLQGKYVTAPPGLDVIQYRLREFEKEHPKIDTEIIALECDRVGDTLKEIARGLKVVTDRITMAQNHLRKRTIKNITNNNTTVDISHNNKRFLPMATTTTSSSSGITTTTTTTITNRNDESNTSISLVKAKLGINESLLRESHEFLESENREPIIKLKLQFTVHDITVDRIVSSQDFDVLDEVIPGVIETIFNVTGRQLNVKELKWEINNRVINTSETRLISLTSSSTTNTTTTTTVNIIGKSKSHSNGIHQMFIQIEPLQTCFLKQYRRLVVANTTITNTNYEDLNQLQISSMDVRAVLHSLRQPSNNTLNNSATTTTTTTIYLQNLNLPTDILDCFLRACRYQNLKRLELINIETLTLNIQLALVLNSMPQLEYVDISKIDVPSNNSNTGCCCCCFAEIICPSLTYFDISGHSLLQYHQTITTTQKNVQGLELFLTRHTRLETLLMNYCIVLPKNAAEICTEDELTVAGEFIHVLIKRGLPLLKRLGFCGNTMVDFSCMKNFVTNTVLLPTNGENNKKLTHLDMSECHTLFLSYDDDYNDDQESYAGLGRALKELLLVNNNFTTAAAAATTNSNYLEHLCLSGCQIKDIGLTCLAKQGFEQNVFMRLKTFHAASVGANMGTGVLDILRALRFVPEIENVQLGYNFQSRFHSSGDGTGGDPQEMGKKFSHVLQFGMLPASLVELGLHGIVLDLSSSIGIVPTLLPFGPIINIREIWLGAFRCNLSWIVQLFKQYIDLQSLYFWGLVDDWIDNEQPLISTNDVSNIDQDYCNTMLIIDSSLNKMICSIKRTKL